MSSVLKIDNINVRRGTKPVLTNISMELEAGKTIAVLGPNGAGKSSLVLSIAGVLPVASGSITLDGKNIGNISPDAVRRTGIATILEGHQVLTELNVDDNLRAAGASLSKPQLAEAMEHAYEVFPELLEIKTRMAGMLSGGQRQMVAVAQALIVKPKFILADEMSLGLAPLIVKRLMNVLETLSQQGVGILLIEQFTHLALQLADYVYVINRGQIHFHGTPAEVEANPNVLHEAYLAGDKHLA